MAKNAAPGKDNIIIELIKYNLEEVPKDLQNTERNI